MKTGLDIQLGTDEQFSDEQMSQSTEIYDALTSALARPE
jgi:hypothetical protein